MTIGSSDGRFADGPDSAYAWRRLLISLIISTVGGIGMWSTVVVLPTIQAEFGLDRGDASLPYFAVSLGFAGGGVLIGRLVDRFGIVLPLIGGSVVLGLGYMVAAGTQNLLQFTLVHGVLIAMFGAAVTFGPLVADVSHWFVRRRGIAIAIIASGNYLSGTFWPPLIQYGIDAVGWRQTHVAIGIICILVMVPLSLLLRRPSPVAQVGPGHVAADRAPLPMSPGRLQVLLVVAALSCCIAMAMPQVHIVAYSGDLGYGAARGAEMLSLMLGLGVVSRLISGAVADRIGGLWTLILGSTLQCLALAFYLPFDGLVSLYVVSGLFGLAQGGIIPSYALIAREYFPAREAAQRISLVLLAAVSGMAIGGWLSGEIYDYTGSYQAAFLNGIAWNILNMAIAAWLLIGRNRTLSTGTA